MDIHCHILPALDEGATEESVAQEMAAMAAADGISHIVATPHSNYRYPFDPEINQRKRDELPVGAAGDSAPAVVLVPALTKKPLVFPPDLAVSRETNRIASPRTE